MEAESFTSSGIAEDTRRGLRDDPKWLSSLYFYDARGSQIFEEICETPEYYPTRTEDAILAAHGDEMVALAGDDLLLAELGSGSSSKTRNIIEAILRRQSSLTYCPVDVSDEILRSSADALSHAYPNVTVEPIVAEYAAGLAAIGKASVAAGQRRLVLFLGSSLGNFEPDEQVALMRAAGDALAPGDALVVGTDLAKDSAVLEAAYDDAAGVTAAFNRNILVHLNRELAGDADPDAFDHVALWNAEKSRVEMHLRSRRKQQLTFAAAALTVDIEKDETIHTENSYKFTLAGMADMATKAGLRLERTWTDERTWFASHLLRRD